MPVQALFKPFQLGALQLSTRVVMAPMTRSFSPGGVATEDVLVHRRTGYPATAGRPEAAQGSGAARPYAATALSPAIRRKVASAWATTWSML